MVFHQALYTKQLHLTKNQHELCTYRQAVATELVNFMIQLVKSNRVKSKHIYRALLTQPQPNATSATINDNKIKQLKRR